MPTEYILDQSAAPTSQIRIVTKDGAVYKIYFDALGGIAIRKTSDTVDEAISIHPGAPNKIRIK